MRNAAADIELGIIAGESERDRLEVVRADGAFELRLQSSSTAGWNTYKRMAFSLEQLRELRKVLAVIDGAERMKENLAASATPEPAGELVSLAAARALLDR